ncbi:homoserine dehydrogenase [Geomesophilobacter sediminis]|uniref:Homoserine dehydrogenase n=1 Tax=Geomesophilobacter sediminis TaxID=2798584 RepID=A0A8J7LUW1_9BACT|nr:homoserine dehydrogenase [Geomesophilobacter sediminis]MBJ6724210.1 homoserine dehydrogenase [Geomesophilobacter sediminis]
MNEIKIGLIGFGTIGAGVVKLLRNNASLIEQKTGARVALKWIADLDITTDRGVSTEGIQLTRRVDDLLHDPEVSVVIELIGGYEPARTFVLKAIENGKHVVTANKALLAVHGDEIYAAAREKGVEVLFEASVGGGIPVLSAIKGNLAANRFSTVLGIVNGTCNYILTRMTQEGADFGDVLKSAQALGYAEADPTFDIEGVDTAHKLCLLLSLCFGTKIDLKDVYCEGITSVTSEDVDFAKNFGYRIKLLAIGKLDGDRIEARVHPTMVPIDYPLADVHGVFNAIRLTGDFVGPVMFYGRGAGMDATASAVIGDVMELTRDMLAGGSRRCAPLGFLDENVAALTLKPMGEIVSKYYIRFHAQDRPGVLARIAGSLGKFGISIASMVQSARSEEVVPIVIMTHEAREGDVRQALEEIDAFDVIRERSNFIRIEDNLE